MGILGVSLSLEEAVTLLALVATITLPTLVVLEAIHKPKEEKIKNSKSGNKKAGNDNGKKKMYTSMFLQETGLEKVLAREIENVIMDGLRQGLVSLSLYSEECHGRVVLDVPTKKFYCMDGERVFPLGEEIAKDMVVEEEGEESSA